MLRRLLSLSTATVLPLAAQSPSFVDHASLLDDSGIDHMNFSSGSPMAVVDVNGDRKDDIVRIHDRDELYVEYQTGTGQPFVHLNLGTLPAVEAWSLCAGDVDRNGYNDFVLGDLHTGHDLYLANGTGTNFVRSDFPSQVQVVQDTIFADLNQDGLVDLFACDDIDDLHKYRNTGGGNFVFDDSLLPTLLTAVGSPDNEGNYAVIGTDYDNDGDIDYYLSKCRLGEGNNGSLTRINRLFENDGFNNYTDVAVTAQLSSGAQSWCADFADIDNDGDMDCFVLNHQNGGSVPSIDSRLYENNGSGVFSDITTAAGMAGQVNFWGIQAVFRDMNNDGWVDLLVSSMGIHINDPTYGYYQNDGDGTFTRLSGVLKFANGTAPVSRIHSFAIGDLNHDGALDLYAGRGTNINFASNDFDLMLMNQGNANGFFTLTLVGDQSNINGIGARIEAHGPWGTQVREVRGGEGYGIMNSLNTHFGLGTGTEITHLKVRWPSGTVDDILPVPGNRFATLHEGTGALAFSFDDWIGDFIPAGGPDAELNADPDHDQNPNVVEQVAGTDPNEPNGMDWIEARRVEDGGQEYLEVRIDRVPTQDLAVSVEFSADGSSWGPGAGLVMEDSPSLLVVRHLIDPLEPPLLLARMRVTVL